MTILREAAWLLKLLSCYIIFSEAIFFSPFYVVYKLHVKSVYTVHTHTFASEYVRQVYFSLPLSLCTSPVLSSFEMEEKRKNCEFL